MNTYQFFYESFGKHFVAPTNRPHVDSQRVLTDGHLALTKNGEQKRRINGGWAILRPGGAVMQKRFSVDGIEFDERTKVTDAFYRELVAWDDTPRMFLVFNNSHFSINNLFITVDLRAVRICTPQGVESFDFTRPAPEKPGRLHRSLEKKRIKDAG